MHDERRQFVIEFNSPDWEEFIEVSIWRDEIRFIVKMSETERYAARLTTLRRERQYLDYLSTRAPGQPHVSANRGQIVVEYLDQDIIRAAVALAVEKGFFDENRMLSALPFAFEGMLEFDRQKGKYIENNEICGFGNQNKKLGFPTIEHLQFHEHDLSKHPEHYEVNVTYGNNERFVVRLASAKSIEIHFESCPEVSANNPCGHVIIPALAITTDLISRSAVEHVVMALHDQSYFLTLNCRY